MNSAGDTAEAVGCPIRKSTDQSLLAAPHGLSQRAASFIASQCQGIHQMPFRRLISFSRLSAMRRSKPAHGSREDTSDRTSFVPAPVHRTGVRDSDLPVILGHKTFFDCQRSRRHRVPRIGPQGWRIWRRPTLPRLKTQYHWRGGFSRPSSGWDRVQAPRYDHQIGQPYGCFEKRYGDGGAGCSGPDLP